MPTFLLPDDPVTSLDAYLASDIGGLGIERAQRIGPAATIDAVLASGLRGRGGGGYLDWPEVGRPQGAGRDPPLRGVQRRRGRARHVQGPRPDPGQPLPARRRGHHRGVRRWRSRDVHLPQTQLRARDRRRHPSRAGIPVGRHLHRLPGHHRRRTRRVPVRRGEGDARGDRGQAAAAALVPALRTRPVRHRPPTGMGSDTTLRLGRWPEPDPRQQRRDAGQRAPHPRPRSRVVPLDGNPGVARHDRRHRRRRRHRPRRRRSRARHITARRHRRQSAAASPRSAPSRPCSPVWPTP